MEKGGFMRNMSIISLFLIVAAAASASTVIESGDAGDMLADAYLLAGGTDKVQGSLNFDADLFKFYWNGGDFYANTINYSLPMNQQKDTELFLFDSDGYGLWANDGAWTGLGLPAASAYVYATDMAPGYYYLGVTMWQLEPCFDLDGYMEYTIFPYMATPSEPTAPWFDAGPLAVWGNSELSSWDSGNYVINFAEASLYTAAAGPSHPVGEIPEPATIGLLGLGALSLLRKRRA
jgi:hypothetical protein